MIEIRFKGRVPKFIKTNSRKIKHFLPSQYPKEFESIGLTLEGWLESPQFLCW